MRATGSMIREMAKALRNFIMATSIKVSTRKERFAAKEDTYGLPENSMMASGKMG